MVCCSANWREWKFEVIYFVLTKTNTGQAVCTHRDTRPHVNGIKQPLDESAIGVSHWANHRKMVTANHTGQVCRNIRANGNVVGGLRILGDDRVASAKRELGNLIVDAVAAMNSISAVIVSL